jgi:uncharacterized membrane protein YdjX (TVP38/TMEM64 family)
VRTSAGSTWARAAVLGLFLTVGAVLALTVDLPSVPTVRAWLDQAGGGTWVALAMGVALVLLLPVPRTAVSVLAGVVAGFGPGTAVALAGGLLAGVVSFGLARSLGRAAVTRLAGPRLATVDGFVAERGFWAVLAGRLLPVVPFVLLSYAAGLTALRLGPYALATAIGLVPGTVVQVGVGASVGVLAAHAATVTVAPAVIAALVLVVLGAFAWRRRRPVREPV